MSESESSDQPGIQMSSAILQSRLFFFLICGAADHHRAATQAVLQCHPTLANCGDRLETALRLVLSHPLQIRQAAAVGIGDAPVLPPPAGLNLFNRKLVAAAVVVDFGFYTGGGYFNRDRVPGYSLWRPWRIR